MPSHNHPFPQNSNGTYDYYWIGQSDEATDFSWSTGPSYELTTNNSVAPQGGGQAHNNLPPYYALCYIIKHTATSGGGFVILPEKSATGTSVEFTGIPSDAKEITLMLLRVSPSGLDDMKVQLGTSSGYITSGYYSASENAQGTVNPNSTDSFIIMNDVGDISFFSGSMVINKSSDTSYTQFGGFYRADGAGCDTYGDLQSVSGTIDRLRIIFSGTNTFDAGKFGLSYKTGGSGSVGAGITIQEEGSTLSTVATTLNFVGAGVTASGTGATKTITINGSSSVTSTWTLGANGSSHYTFTGPGGLSNTDDPKIYLARGQTYEFVNNSGGSHPFQIQQSNGSAYGTGVTNNGASSGTIRFEVPFSAPNTLQYKCTNHSSMGNTIIIYPDLSP